VCYEKLFTVTNKVLARAAEVYKSYQKTELLRRRFRAGAFLILFESKHSCLQAIR